MSIPEETVLPLSSAERIASYQLLPPNGFEIEVAQAIHRINLINAWGPAVIFPGARVLEIGCGQGNCTAVLAEAVGPQGRIDAFDPAPPDYGSPFTLAQAQAHISQSDIGSRITWHRDLSHYGPRGVEHSSGGGDSSWDVVVLSHCIWYFQQPREELTRVLSRFRDMVKDGGKICIAEYALRATEKAAVPHLLAALAKGMLGAQKQDESTENIENILSSGEIIEIARDCEWRVNAEAFLIPGDGLLDGQWETGGVVSPGFLRQIENLCGGDEWAETRLARVKTGLRSARAAVLASVEAIGGVKKTRTMDVWTGVFSRLQPDSTSNTM